MDIGTFRNLISRIERALSDGEWKVAISVFSSLCIVGLYEIQYDRVCFDEFRSIVANAREYLALGTIPSGEYLIKRDLLTVLQKCEKVIRASKFFSAS